MRESVLHLTVILLGGNALKETHCMWQYFQFHTCCDLFFALNAIVIGFQMQQCLCTSIEKETNRVFTHFAHLLPW